MKYVLLSYDGRISRSQYWIMGILPLLGLAFLWVITFIPVSYFLPWASILVSIGAILGLVWGFTAVSVKRCHDMGHSGFWILLYLVPGVALVGLIVLGVRHSSCPNEYDHIEEVPVWLRKGENGACPSCSPLCADHLLRALVGAQLQSRSSSRLRRAAGFLSDARGIGGRRGDSCGHRESWNESMAGRNGSQCIVFLVIRAREAPADSQWRPNGPCQ